MKSAKKWIKLLLKKNVSERKNLTIEAHPTTPHHLQDTQ